VLLLLLDTLLALRLLTCRTPTLFTHARPAACLYLALLPALLATLLPAAAAVCGLMTHRGVHEINLGYKGLVPCVYHLVSTRTLAHNGIIVCIALNVHCNC
jgi:hypothetical protein